MARPERVTTVIDGDTFRTKSRKNSVRLANVDAPEFGAKRSGGSNQALEKTSKRKNGNGSNSCQGPLWQNNSQSKVGWKIC